MVSQIQPLPSEVVHLIAAGEVIDSIAAVVRELVENALDAGATRITVSLIPEQWQIRVVDNGAGMTLEDLQQAAAPHSTSKIHSSADLWRISSLGFRGEALHSLAQLADLEICSRNTAQNPGTTGWKVTYNSQGEPVQTEAAAIAPGTIVRVSNLFQIWPARRQGLPSPLQQLRTVQGVIHQLALCHPQVTWQVEQNQQSWFTLYPGESAQQILPQLLPNLHSGDLRELAIVMPAPPDSLPTVSRQLYLVLGLPDSCHRRRPDWIRVAVNGRCVKIPELEQTILNGFRRTLPRDRYPICFLHLQLATDDIDWNRHPAKAEVYLKHLDYWQEQITQAIAQILSFNSTRLSESYHSERVQQLLKTAESQSGYHVSHRIETTAADSPSDPEASPPETVSLLHALQAIAQVHQTYILAEHPSGMWLVEQHIAHERVLYEQLCDRWQIVPLNPAIILSQLSPSQIEQLQRLQLEVEPFGEQLWAVRSAPELLAQREDCTDALLELSLGGDLQTAMVATACRSAIRNGMPLTLEEMQSLLDQWQQTRNPRTCPHGRPIYLSLEESALSRFFRRHWVIGKSHGI